MYNKEAMRKLLEDCWITGAAMGIETAERDVWITTRLAALDDGDEIKTKDEIFKNRKLNELPFAQRVVIGVGTIYEMMEEYASQFKRVDDGQEGKGLRWVKASERLPDVNDLYHTNIQMRDTDLDTFPSTNNYFTKSGWEIADDYEVIEWLDEGQPAQGGKP